MLLVKPCIDATYAAELRANLHAGRTNAPAIAAEVSGWARLVAAAAIKLIRLQVTAITGPADGEIGSTNATTTCRVANEWPEA